MNINNYITKQFSNPKGFGGSLISLIMNRQNSPLYYETIKLLSLLESDSVLDIGCGNGYVLNLMAQKCKATYTGIDTSSSIIETANRRNRIFVKNKKMSFSCQDVSNMAFICGDFSKVYTINTVYFWSDPAKSMSEICRVLKHNGVFINTLYSNETLSRFSHTQSGYKRYTTEELVGLGEKIGFTVKCIPILQGTAYCYIYQKLTNEVL